MSSTFFHGQLVPIQVFFASFHFFFAVFSFGMGVDQVVEVELVGADGSLIVANGQ